MLNLQLRLYPIDMNNNESRLELLLVGSHCSFPLSSRKATGRRTQVGNLSEAHREISEISRLRSK